MRQDGSVVAQAGISTREAEVLSLLGEHLSNAEIGSRLFEAVGCRYQWARTLVLTTGEAAMADLGLAPMTAHT
ncbi:hypothetical protein [Actinokineospora sp.]|uniref:hypothetical protein n=1 Tax=Actinokineospora sp. TaxID=1872133 RepID=UPI003D6C5FE4